MPMSKLFIEVLYMIHSLNHKILREFVNPVIISEVMRHSVLGSFVHADLCVRVDKRPIRVLKSVSRFGSEGQVALSALS